MLFNPLLKEVVIPAATEIKRVDTDDKQDNDKTYTHFCPFQNFDLWNRNKHPSEGEGSNSERLGDLGGKSFIQSPRRSFNPPRFKNNTESAEYKPGFWIAFPEGCRESNALNSVHPEMSRNRRSKRNPLSLGGGSGGEHGGKRWGSYRVSLSYRHRIVLALRENDLQVERDLSVLLFRCRSAALREFMFRA